MRWENLDTSKANIQSKGCSCHDKDRNGRAICFGFVFGSVLIWFDLIWYRFEIDLIWYGFIHSFMARTPTSVCWLTILLVYYFWYYMWNVLYCPVLYRCWKTVIWLIDSHVFVVSVIGYWWLVIGCYCRLLVGWLVGYSSTIICCRRCSRMLCCCLPAMVGRSMVNERTAHIKKKGARHRSVLAPYRTNTRTGTSTSTVRVFIYSSLVGCSFVGWLVGWLVGWFLGCDAKQ